LNKSGKKVALITGAARRLGKEITSELASLGFNIALNYNSTAAGLVNKFKKTLEQKGVEVLPIKADVSDVKDIGMMFGKIKEYFGRIDVLVNNAAVFEHTDFLKTGEKTFDKFINTNLKSVFFCSQYAAKMMLNQKGNNFKIINIASLGGIENWTGFMPYSIAKAGVIKLTMLLAKKLAPGILVNSISPGTVWIDNDKNKTVDKNSIGKYTMKRFAKPDDLKALIRYLAGDNTYITGQNFIVDGGKSL
jgi:3-oxoacyl-[acyl-carrier protein] reductase